MRVKLFVLASCWAWKFKHERKVHTQSWEPSTPNVARARKKFNWSLNSSDCFPFWIHFPIVKFCLRHLNLWISTTRSCRKKERKFVRTSESGTAFLNKLSPIVVIVAVIIVLDRPSPPQSILEHEYAASTLTLLFGELPADQHSTLVFHLSCHIRQPYFAFGLIKFTGLEQCVQKVMSISTSCQISCDKCCVFCAVTIVIGRSWRLWSEWRHVAPWQRLHLSLWPDFGLQWKQVRCLSLFTEEVEWLSCPGEFGK